MDTKLKNIISETEIIKQSNIENTSSQINIIKKNINEILLSKEILKTSFSRKMRGNWFLANLRLGLKKIETVEENIKKKNINFAQITKNLYFAEISFKFAKKMWDLRDLFQNYSENEGENFIISKKALKIGDIILSYKTSDYLSSHSISSFVAFVQNSHITHSSVVFENKNDRPKMFTIKSGEKCITFLDAEPELGEILLVLETENDFKKRDTYLNLIHEIISHKKSVCDGINCPYNFSEIKFWWACFIGFLDVLSIRFFSRHFTYPFLINSAKGMFL